MWCLWLLGSWLASGSDGAQVASRRMVFACLTGLMLMWPVLRLAQSSGRPLKAEAVLWDWFCLNLVMQAVIWSLHVSAEWSLAQAFWLDAACAGWSLLTGLLLLAGGGWTSAPGRVAALGLCVLLVLGEPLLMAVVSAGRSGVLWVMWLSPIDTIWALTDRPPRILPAHVIGVAAVAAGGWLGAGLWWAGTGRGRSAGTAVAEPDFPQSD